MFYYLIHYFVKMLWLQKIFFKNSNIYSSTLNSEHTHLNYELEFQNRDKCSDVRKL